MAWGVIFDLDGVLLESGALHIKAWVEFARMHGFSQSDDYFWKTFGQRNHEIIPDLFGTGLSQIFIDEKSELKEALFRKLARGVLKPLPGAKELVTALKEQGIPMAVGTSTPASNLAFYLQELPFLNQMNGYVCGSDVSKGKPDPEVFLKAGATTGLDPQNLVVIEDALAGVAAAKAGGFHCIAVATTEPLDVLRQTKADLVVKVLTEISVERLKQVSSNQ